MHYIPAQIVVVFITVHFKRISASHFPHHKYICSLFVNVLNEILRIEHMFRLVSIGFYEINKFKHLQKD